MLAEATTIELFKTHNSQSFEENVKSAQRGGKIARKARKNIETDTRKAVIISQNATELNKVVTDLVEGTVEEIKKQIKSRQEKNMEQLINVINVLKIPLKVLIPTACLCCGALLLLEEEILEKLYLLQWKNENGFIIGVIFLITISLIKCKAFSLYFILSPLIL